MFMDCVLMCLWLGVLDLWWLSLEIVSSSEEDDCWCVGLDSEATGGGGMSAMKSSVLRRLCWYLFFFSSSGLIVGDVISLCIRDIVGDKCGGCDGGGMKSSFGLSGGVDNSSWDSVGGGAGGGI